MGFAGLVPNSKGRVLRSVEEGSSFVAGLFVVGWLKRGPTGIIGTNLIDADETVLPSFLADFASSRIQLLSAFKASMNMTYIV